MAEFILASGSPRRKQLLEWAEVDFEICVQPTEEILLPHLSPADAAIHIAAQKAVAVQKFLETPCTIIAADTIVVLNDEIIGKPKDRVDAIGILTRLSGKIHTVITGVVIQNKEKYSSFSDATEVEFHALTGEQIKFYIDKYQPYDKAGAYAIQEWIGVTGIKRISGDFYNVMGLPVSRVVQTLEKFRTFGA
jgi:septum formation protein